MNIKEKLRNNFPKTIDKTGKVFTSLVASDDGEAVIENELTILFNYVLQWRNVKNIYLSRETIMSYLANSFSFLKQFKDEKDVVFLKRLNAIFYRDGDKKWGTPQNVINTFRNYFSTAEIYLAENTNKENENLLRNPKFDSEDFWIFNQAELNPDARFASGKGVSFLATNSFVSQEVSLEANKLYYIHVFYKGKIRLNVENAHSVVWNKNEEKYENTIAECEFESDKWENAQMFFISDSDTVNVKITGEKDTWVDYPRLYEKMKNPSFTIYVQFTGDSSKGALVLAPGSDDPTEEIKKYNKAGYYDEAFITGVNSGYAMDLYEELLSYVKAIGVMAYIEIVNRTKDIA